MSGTPCPADDSEPNPTAAGHVIGGAQNQSVVSSLLMLPDGTPRWRRNSPSSDRTAAVSVSAIGSRHSERSFMCVGAGGGGREGDWWMEKGRRELAVAKDGWKHMW